MAVAVVLDAVAAARDLAHDLWMFGRLLADAEEACLGVMAIQPVENARCDPRIWAVVESQRDLAAPGGLVGQPVDVRTEEPRARQEYRGGQKCVVRGEHRDDPGPRRHIDRQRSRAGGVDDERYAGERRRPPRARPVVARGDGALRGHFANACASMRCQSSIHVGQSWPPSAMLTRAAAPRCPTTSLACPSRCCPPYPRNTSCH